MIRTASEEISHPTASTSTPASATPARVGLIGDGHRAERFGDPGRGLHVADVEDLNQTGVGEECAGALAVDAAELMQVLEDRPRLQAVAGHKSEGLFQRLRPPQRGELVKPQ